MQSNILISVLMAVYNTRVEYLSEAVESILSQTYRNIEFIIIDDCSIRQDTIQYLDALDDKRIVLIRNEENIGLTKSLNKGLDLAHGKYIARMDSDDISLPNRLYEQCKYAETKKSVFVGADFSTIPTHKFKPFFSYEPNQYKLRMIFDNVGPMHSSFFFNREYFIEKGIKYNENYRSAQDYALLCDILSAGCEVGFCKKKLLYWRVNDEQTSVIHSEEQWSNAKNIRRNYIKNNYKVSDENLEFIVNSLNREFSMNKNIDLAKAQKVLKEFMIDNQKTKLISQEVYRYWFVEALRRLKRLGKVDVVFTRMFMECFFPVHFLYIAKDVLLSRCGYV